MTSSKHKKRALLTGRGSCYLLGRRLSWCRGLRLRVVVGCNSHADADRDKYQGGVAGNGGFVQHIVDDCRHGREEHAAQLIDCHCTEGQGEVGQYDVQAHR